MTIKVILCIEDMLLRLLQFLVAYSLRCWLDFIVKPVLYCLHTLVCCTRAACIVRIGCSHFDNFYFNGMKESNVLPER